MAFARHPQPLQTTELTLGTPASRALTAQFYLNP